MTLFWIIYYLVLSISLYFVFQKAGEQGWKGLVPGYNFVVWSRLIGRQPWWAALMLLPIVNIFIYAGFAVKMVRSFGKLKFWHSALAVVVTPFYFLYLGLNKKDTYEGPILDAEKAYKEKIEEAKSSNKTKVLQKLEANNPFRKSASREWVEAIIFAVFAAAFIRMFLIEAYMIPTSSMEGSLMVGDFLFVSKASYGIRTPETIAMVPLLHNRIPGLNVESYLKKPSLKHRRLPAIRKIDYNSPVVFNFPAGDSVYVFPHRTWSIQDVRYGALPTEDARAVKNGRKPLVTRPMDKRDHYIKRCVGLPGDEIKIVNRQLYINGKPTENPTKLQYIYHVKVPNGINTNDFTGWGISDEDRLKSDNATGSMLLILNEEQAKKVSALDPQIVAAPTMEYTITTPEGYTPQLLSQYGIDDANFRGMFQGNRLFFSLTDEQAAAVRKDTLLNVKNTELNPLRLFPHKESISGAWTVDNYGPIKIPKMGETITLTNETLAYYERIITVYEGNILDRKDGKFYINGQEASTYTFNQNYYWMMGDNRHNSEDSRVWGFVPESHIVGRPLFIWFALREGKLSKGIDIKRIGPVSRLLR